MGAAKETRFSQQKSLSAAGSLFFAAFIMNGVLLQSQKHLAERRFSLALFTGKWYTI